MPADHRPLPRERTHSNSTPESREVPCQGPIRRTIPIPRATSSRHPAIPAVTLPVFPLWWEARKLSRPLGPRADKYMSKEHSSLAQRLSPPLGHSWYCFMSACNRDQDQTTPVGQQQGQGTAQDYPSTRNMEQPNPSIGGTNSATNKPAPSGNQEPKAGSTTR